MKQTAVEWYNLKVIELMTQREQENIDVLEFRNQLDLLLTQAKEMEKEQIAQAFEDGAHNYFYSIETGEGFESGIEYYNEKFKQTGTMNISEAIGILRLHRKWEKGVDIVKISTEDLQLAMDTIIDLLDPEFIVGMTPNAWDLSFIRKLQIEIGKLPYHQGLDDGGFNDGLAQGFEQGAQWVWDNFKLEVK